MGARRRHGVVVTSSAGVALLFALAMSIGTALVTPPGAAAAFPGTGGELMYTWVDVSGKALYSSSGLAAFDMRANARRSVMSCLWDRMDHDCAIEAGAASPDGTGVAAIVTDWTDGNLTPTARRLAVLSPDGAEVASVPLGGRPVFDPAWSPAGDRLAVTRYDGATGEWGDGMPRIAILALDGTEVATATPAGGSDADWAVTGAIAYVHEGDIWITTLDGPPRRLTVEGGTAPSWSPDGTRIAFVRDGRIWLMAADGSDQRPLTGTDASDVAWSPDGRQLAFSRRAPLSGYSGRGSYGDVWVIAADGRCPRAIVRAFGWSFYGRPFWRPPAAGSTGAEPLPPCAHLRPDLRAAKSRVGARQARFRYRFEGWPRTAGRAVFRTRARVSRPGRRSGPRRRLTVARQVFRVDRSGVARLRPRLSDAGRDLLHARRRLRLTAIVTVRDDTGAKPAAATARKPLTLVATR